MAKLAKKDLQLVGSAGNLDGLKSLIKKKQKQTVIIVTAYGEDNYFQKRYEDLVGIYTDIKKAIKGAKADGMTNAQQDYLNRINAFYMLDISVQQNRSGESYQVEYEEETDRRRKHCNSSYMFRTFNLD